MELLWDGAAMESGSCGIELLRIVEVGVGAMPIGIMCHDTAHLRILTVMVSLLAEAAHAERRAAREV